MKPTEHGVRAMASRRHEHNLHDLQVWNNDEATHIGGGNGLIRTKTVLV